MSTIDAYQAAATHVFQLSVAETIAPWLDARIEQVCDDNAQTLLDLIDTNTVTRDEADAQAHVELDQGFTILGDGVEDATAFALRMKLDFTQNGPAVEMASGLPVFNADCDPEDSENLDAATLVIDESNVTSAFSVWLNEQFTGACDEIEMIAYEGQIDPVSLTNKEASRDALFADWFEVDEAGPSGETLDEFKTRTEDNFAASGTETTDSGIEVAPYPDDCVEYSTTIDASHDALLDFKTQIEACLTFEQWAVPQLIQAQEDHCLLDTMNLEFETSSVAMQASDIQG
jgi:hypothetical protein